MNHSPEFTGALRENGEVDPYNNPFRILAYTPRIVLMFTPALPLSTVSEALAEGSLDCRRGEKFSGEGGQRANIQKQRGMPPGP